MSFEEEDGDCRPALPAGVGDGPTQPIEEERAIGEAGQRVMERLVRQLLFGLLIILDVVDVGDDPTDGWIVEEVREVQFDPAPRAVTVPDPDLDREAGTGRGEGRREG